MLLLSLVIWRVMKIQITGLGIYILLDQLIATKKRLLFLHRYNSTIIKQLLTHAVAMRTVLPTEGKTCSR